MTTLTTAKLSSCERRRRTNENNDSHVRRYCFTLKTAPLFAPSARSLLFLFFSLEERESWPVGSSFMQFGKNRKTEKKHRIKSSVIGAKIKKCRAERCDWTRVNSQTVRVYDTHHSFVHIFNHRICDVDFFRDTTSRTLASAGLDKNQLFPCHKFRTLEICIDRSFTHPPFYNFPSN
jgi:hypothetical protein